MTLNSIAVTPASLSLPLNSLQRLAAIGTYSDGSTQNLGGNVTWSSSSTAVATIDTTGVLTALAQGQTSVQASFGSLSGATTLTVKGPSFQPVGSLNQARWEHTATLLPNGQVLVVGGGSQTDFLTSAELYDPIAKTFSFTGSLGTSRWGHTATLLQNGKVLIVGGDTLISGNSVPLATAEIYDPQTGNFTPTGSLHSARVNHTATLLNNGKVLFVGDVDLFSSTLTAELYDPAAGTFSDTGVPVHGEYHTATLLNDGTVLIAGGLDQNGNATGNAVIYDPSAGTFTTVGNLNTASSDHSSTLLNNGKVLVAGGANPTFLTRAELYDPAAKTFAGTASLALARDDQTATLLNGTVLIVGGNLAASPFVTGTAEQFDPSSQTFIGAGSLATARSAHTATLLNDGTVLIVGGSGAAGILASAELFAPPLPPPASLQITPATSNLLVGQKQQFKVFDEIGHQRFDVTWTVSDPTIAPITPGGAPTLTAISAGQVTLAANVQGVVGQLQIAIAPASLQVTPARANMQVGDTRQFTVIDNLGHPSTAVVWTVSNPSLATVSADNQTNLTALAAGQVTLTATVEGVTSQAQLTIWPQGAIPSGTALWSSSTVSGFAPLQLAQAPPTDTGPGLYSIQASTDGTQSIVQALTSDGQQMWQASLAIVNGNSVPDGDGGLIVTEHNTCLSGQTDPMTIVDLDGLTGQPKWQLQAAGVQQGNSVVYCYPDTIPFVDEPKFAIRNDGSVVIAAMINNGLPPLSMSDGTIINIPTSTSTDPTGRQFADFSPEGPPIVNTDGSTYIEYEVRQVAYPPKITSAALNLLQIGPSPNNTQTTLQLSSTTNDENLLPGRIIPDGQGGVIATWTISPSTGPVPTHPFQAAHVVGGAVSATYDLPFSPTKITLGQYPTMVLGQNSMIFATDGADSANGPQVASLNPSSGAVQWASPFPTGDTLELVVALEGGGVAVKDTASSGVQIVRFDVNGTRNNDGWNAVGLSADFVSGTDTWNGSPDGISFAEVLEPYAAVPVQSVWAFPEGNPSRNGSAVAFILNGIPSWGGNFFAGTKPPKCVSVATAPKAPLTGNPLARYTDKRQKLLNGGYLTSTTCATLFNTNQTLAQKFSMLTSAVTNQVAYDGSHSSIKLYDAGTWVQADLTEPEYLVNLKNTSMSCELDTGINSYPANPRVAVSQTQPPATDMYINTFNYKLLTQSTILHEAIHNLTTTNDVQLKGLLGLDATLGRVATDDINRKLEAQGCAGTN